jgi:toxin secretion/phage lysis holin
MNRVKWISTVILSALTAFAQKYVMIIIFVAIMVMLDTVTGIIASIVSGEKLSSEKGAIGFWKKMALFAALAFGFTLDYFISYMLTYVNIKAPAGAVFGIVIGCYIVVNEAISVCENLYRCNDEILPKWVAKLLTQSKDTIDKVE